LSIEIGIQVALSTLLVIAQFCYVLTELVAASVATVVPLTGRCHATNLLHPPPPTVPSVPLLRSKAVCKVSHIHGMWLGCSWRGAARSDEW